jgi:ABC-type iron transport system FetAB permease component
MNIRLLILTSAFMAGGILTARAYRSDWGQAVVFTSTQVIVSFVFSNFLLKYVNSGPQAALLLLAMKPVGYIAGVLMTGIISGKSIAWDSAVASMFVAPWASGAMCIAFMSIEQVAVLKA